MQRLPRQQADPVNRRQRRRRAAAERLLSARGEVFTRACWDCCATAAVGMDDGGRIALHVYHSATCPAVAGFVPFRCGAEGQRR